MTEETTSVENENASGIKKTLKEDSKALELAIAQLQKQYGSGAVIKLGSTNVKPWSSIPTGALTLDHALGIGGLPRGRVVEIFGPESSGKSTLALTAVAKAQQMGLTCAYIDAEHALDPVYMQAVGIDLDNLLLAQPDYGEQGFDIADRLLRTGDIGLIVIDSVAALVPKAELDGEMEQMQMGLQARMMAKAMRKLTGLASQHDTLIIFINQLRNKLNNENIYIYLGMATKSNENHRPIMECRMKVYCVMSAIKDNVGKTLYPFAMHSGRYEMLLS